MRTYFRGVQIFAIFANESQTAKINPRENFNFVLALFRYLYPTCTDSHLLDPKSIKNIVTIILTHAATQNVWKYRIIADLTYWNHKNKNPQNIS